MQKADKLDEDSFAWCVCTQHPRRFRKAVCVDEETSCASTLPTSRQLDVNLSLVCPTDEGGKITERAMTAS
jgi:hypothetical protein